MAKINDNVVQVKTILNTVMTDAYGAKAMTNIDVSDLSSVYDYVNSTAINKTVFFESLYAMFSNQIFANRVYNAASLPIWRDEAEFGQLILKTYMTPLEATDNEIYDVVDGMEVSSFKVALAEIKSAIIEKSATWQVQLSCANDVLKSGFQNYETLAAFLEQQYVELDNSMADELEKMENMLICRFIAIKKAKEATGLNCINILAAYNAEASTSLTAANCLSDVDFLNFCNRYILTKIKLMQKRLRLFNTESFVRHTPIDANKILFLDAFDSANVTVLRANTYHDELVSYTGFQTVPFWQAPGEAGAFTDCSAIDIKHGEITTKMDGILAVVFDEYAIGATMKNRNTQSEYSKRFDLTHTWERATMQYYVDPSENGMVFYVAD